MKKKTKIILTIIGVLIIAIAIFAVIQRNNIKALAYFLFYSQEKVNELTAQNDEAIAETLNKLPDITLRELTDDERKKLGSGEISQEEAVRLIIGRDSSPVNANPETCASNQSSTSNGDGTSNTSSSNANNSVDDGSSGNNNNGTTANATEPAQDDPLAELLAHVYILRAKYVNSLEDLKKEAKAEYNDYPEAERSSMKLKLGRKYLALGLSLEAECDKEMDALLKQIEAEINATGGDKSVVSDIRSLYEAEKSLKKAEYLSLYN